MKNRPAYPLMGDPDYNPDNLTNPYGYDVVDNSRGEVYFNAPASNSTMSSDSVEMTKRLRAFVPKSSVKEGREPTNNLFTSGLRAQEDNRGSPDEENTEGHYQSTYQ